jgi:hypothetical protein
LPGVLFNAVLANSANACTITNGAWMIHSIFKKKKLSSKAGFFGSRFLSLNEAGN